VRIQADKENLHHEIIGVVEIMNYKIEKQLVEQAISNCNRVDYPVAVKGQDFADDLAHALGVINVLLIQVEKLEKYIEYKVG